MSVTIQVGQSVTATPTESNAAGPVPIVPANIAWTVDNPSFASFVVDPNTGIATFTGVGVGTADVTVKDTVNNLAFSDTLVVTAGSNLPTAITFTFGTPTGPTSGPSVAKKVG